MTFPHLLLEPRRLLNPCQNRDNESRAHERQAQLAVIHEQQASAEQDHRTEALQSLPAFFSSLPMADVNHQMVVVVR